MSNLTIQKSLSFANGTVHLLHTADGYPLETTDTFLPYYMKKAGAVGNNFLRHSSLTSLQQVYRFQFI